MINTHVTINSNIFVLFLGSLSPSGKYYHVFAPGRLSAIIALGRRARAKWHHFEQKRWPSALTLRSVRCTLLQNNIDLLQICSTYPGQRNTCFVNSTEKYGIFNLNCHTWRHHLNFVNKNKSCKFENGNTVSFTVNLS